MGTLYVMVGHGGNDLRGTSNDPLFAFTEKMHGSVLLNLNPNAVIGYNIRDDGLVTDSFCMMKGNKGLALYTPRGGESVPAVGTYPLRWQTIGTVDRVDIKVSIDEGISLAPVITQLANNGQFPFSFPLNDTERLELQVSDVTDERVFTERPGSLRSFATQEKVAISNTAFWRYYYKAAAPPSSWMTAAFDDSGWGNGNGQFGFGDNDELTDLTQGQGPPGYPTAYFRHKFNVLGGVRLAELNVLHDDGVAVFVNGTEVFKEYMDNGLEHQVFASQASADDEVSQAFSGRECVQKGRKCHERDGQADG